MKKLYSAAIILTALLAGAASVEAQPRYKKHKKQRQGTVGYDPYPDRGPGVHRDTRRAPEGYYNRRGVYIYHYTRNVWRRGRMFRNTYKVRIFPNGRRKVRLVRSVPLHRHYGRRVFYRTVIERRGWRRYRVTYRIVRFPNGRVKRRVVRRVRIYRNYDW